MLKNFGESQKLKVEFFLRAVKELFAKQENKQQFFDKLIPAVIYANQKKINEIINEVQIEALKRKINESYESSDRDTYKFLVALREFYTESFANAIYSSMHILKSKHIPRNDVLKIIHESAEKLLKSDFDKLSQDDKEAIKDGIAILLKLTNENFSSIMLKAEYALKNKQYAVSLQYYLKAHELLGADKIDYNIVLNIAEIAEILNAQRTVKEIVIKSLRRLNAERKHVKTSEQLAEQLRIYIDLSFNMASIYLATGESEKAEKILAELHEMLPQSDKILFSLTEARKLSPPEDFEDVVSMLKEIEKKYSMPEEREERVKQELKQVEILCDLKNRPDLAREILIRLPDEYLHPKTEELTEIQAYVQIRLGFCNLLLGMGEIEENYRKCKNAYEQFSENSTIFSIYLFVLAASGKDDEIADLLLDEDWQNSMVKSNAMPQQLLDFTKNFEHLIEKGDFEAAGEELKALKQFIDPRMQFMHAPLLLHSTFLYGPLPPKITKEELISSFEKLEQTWQKIPKLYRAMNGLEFYMFLWKASQTPFSVEDAVNLSDTPPLGKLFNEIVINAWFKEAFFKLRKVLPSDDFKPSMESWYRVAKNRFDENDTLGTKIAMTFSAISKLEGVDIFNDEGFLEFCENFIKFGLTEMEAVGVIFNNEESEDNLQNTSLPFDNSEMIRVQIRLVFTVFPILRFLIELKRNKAEFFTRLQDEIVSQFSFGFEVFNYIEKTF
ncbi:MAG: hypothetical protein K8S87_04735 [Planctomycetes bacterium]|nr:hypothetical protein [Planctomycetota bacterium]